MQVIKSNKVPMHKQIAYKIWSYSNHEINKRSPVQLIFKGKLHHKGNTSITGLTEFFLWFVLCVIMKATVFLCFSMLSCVFLLVEGKSIKANHGKDLLFEVRTRITS